MSALSLFYHLLDNDKKGSKVKKTYLPQFEQKHLPTMFPLPVSQSSYTFKAALESLISTFARSMAKLDAT